MTTRFNLREVKLEVTYRCNLGCIHCSSDAIPTSPLEMSPRDCFRVLAEAVELGAEKIAFSGGEPLLWTSIEEAVRVASSSGAHVSLYTSGYVANATASITELAKGGLDVCIVSIFGASSHDHENVTRKRGSYRRAKAAVKASAEAGMDTQLHFVPLRSTYEQLDQVVEQGTHWGAGQVSVLRLVPQGRAVQLHSELLGPVENQRLKRMIRRLRSQGFDIRTGSPYNFLLLNDQPRCSSGMDRITVGPDLRVYPCDAFKQIRAEDLVGTLELSSLDGANLSDCWQGSPFLAAVREHLTTPFIEPCLSCPELDRCLSGCLAQKCIVYGDLGKRPDPMCLLGCQEV
jgi:radical SAM protein with 4Fe4S-binding SPASM domain